MAKNKTTETENSVAAYIAAIQDEKRRRDCSALIDLLSKHTGYPAKMWGTGIVGFGIYHYQYPSGHAGSAPLAGFASRVNALTLYVGCDFENCAALLAKLGKYKRSKACIYIKNLEDINTDIFLQMVTSSIVHTQKQYPN